MMLSASILLLPYGSTANKGDSSFIFSPSINPYTLTVLIKINYFGRLDFINPSNKFIVPNTLTL